MPFLSNQCALKPKNSVQLGHEWTQLIEGWEEYLCGAVWNLQNDVSRAYNRSRLAHCAQELLRVA
jgi:hypothetical protein